MKLDREVFAKAVKRRKRKPLFLTPADAPRYLKLSLSFANSKDDAGSAAAAELAARADPKSRDAWVLLGSALARLRQWDRAVYAYERAAALDPTHISTWTALGELALGRHDFKAASKLLEKAMKLDPDAKHPAGRRARALVGKAIAQLRS